MNFISKFRIIKFNFDEKSLNKLLYKHEKSFVEDNILIQSTEKKISYDELLEAKLFVKNHKKKKFPLKGHDLIKLGFEKNKVIGNVLKHTESWWIKNNFSKNKKSCLKFAIKYLP